MANGKRKWVSDIIGDDYKKWKNEFVILDCGTGCGKSYFCLHLLADYAQYKQRKILYLCNRKKLDEQIFEDIKINKLLGTVFVETYQALQKKIQDKEDIPFYDYIVADECHYFTTDAPYNDETDLSYDFVMKKKNCVVILASATAKKMFKDLLSSKKVKRKNYYNIDMSYSYVNKVYYYEKDELVSIINDILENETDSKMMIFINSSERILDMSKKYKDQAQYYCSENTSDRKLKRLCGWNDNGENHTLKMNAQGRISIEKRILFTTSVLDNGVDVYDEKLKHIFSELLDIDMLVQSLGRKRSMHSEDTCTFYIGLYQSRGIQGIMNPLKIKLEQIGLYLKDYDSFLEQYGNGKNQNILRKNDIFYDYFQKNKSNNKIKYRKCRYRKYRQDYEMYSLIKEVGHMDFLNMYLPKELADKSERIVANAKDIDIFLEFLKGIEGKRLYTNDQEYIVREFGDAMAVKLRGRTVKIGTLNGQLYDLYGDTYPCRFYNHNLNGDKYIDKNRNLKNGKKNPNRNRAYWILEDRSNMVSEDSEGIPRVNEKLG